MKTKTIPYLVAAMFCATAGSGIAQPSIQVFTNKAEFLAGTGATSATGPLPNLGLIPGEANARLHLGSVTFTLAPPAWQLYCANYAHPDGTVLLPAEMLISERENLNADFDAPVLAAGYDFVEPTFSNNPQSCPLVDSTFTVTLRHGSTNVGYFSFNAPNDTVAFVGVQSSELFDRLEIRETAGGCDNEFFGEFYAGGPPALAIRRLVDSRIEVSWPTNASGFELEAASVLPAPSWNVVTNAAQAFDGRFTVTIEPAESQRYFRLRR